MEDVLFITGTLGFFALGLAYVRLCDRIIGPDPVEPTKPAPRPSADGRAVEANR